MLCGLQWALFVFQLSINRQDITQLRNQPQKNNFYNEFRIAGTYFEIFKQGATNLIQKLRRQNHEGIWDSTAERKLLLLPTVKYSF